MIGRCASSSSTTIVSIELLRAILPPPGFEAAAAVNGAHAIDQIMAEPPDLMIPRSDDAGHEWLLNCWPRCAAIRARDLPVIVLTAKKRWKTSTGRETAQSAQSIILKTDAA
ncbi:MAG: hypothetical protein U0559_05230 [Anaerolineae bacterium]